MPCGADLKSIGELLSRLTGRLELGEGQERQKILGMWHSIVGDDLGRLAQPAGFRKSVLLVRTSHPAASMELRMRMKEILDRLNGAAGRQLFASMRIICSGTDAGRIKKKG